MIFTNITFNILYCEGNIGGGVAHGSPFERGKNNEKRKIDHKTPNARPNVEIVQL